MLSVAGVNRVLLDVVRPIVHNFPLVVYVVDKDAAMSDEITLTVKAPEPLADIYNVSQIRGEGDLALPNIWRRQGVTHTLTFNLYNEDETTHSGQFRRNISQMFWLRISCLP